MKILGINFGSQKPAKIEETLVFKSNDLEKNSVNAFDFSCNYDSNKVIQMYNTSGYYTFGADNLYPNKLKAYRAGSSLHNAILNWKEINTVGNGYTTDITTLKGMQNIEYSQIINLFDGENNLDDALAKMSANYWMYGAIYIKVTWNEDNTKIIKRQVIDSDKMRWGDVDENGKALHYVYCWDWTRSDKTPQDNEVRFNAKATRFPLIRYAKFDPMDTKNKVQIMSYGIPSLTSLVYPLPTYYSAEKWLSIDTNIPDFQDSNIKNSVQPSIAVKFFKQPGSPEKKREIAEDFERQFKGMRNAGKAIMMFTEPGFEPKIETIAASQLDKQFQTLSDSAQRSILYANGISPILAGFKTPGSLGSGQEMPVAFELAKMQHIVPAQKVIEKMINRIFSINGLVVNFKLNPPVLNVI